MINALLFLLVVGAVMLALAVDLAAAIGWVRRRFFRSPQNMKLTTEIARKLEPPSSKTDYIEWDEDSHETQF
jgi:hypothetical protein